MKLSIVSTMYYSAPHLEAFVRRASAAAEMVTQDYELILVNDGSPDDALGVATRLAKDDAHIVLVDLSRNFGHHKAMMTGLAQTKGEFVFLIDCDLEEPPELLGEFWRELAADKETDVIYGVQRARKGGLMERLSGGFYYGMFNALSNVKLEKNISVVRLMTRRYVDSLLLHREHELVFAGLAALTGYRQKGYVFDKASKGSTTYTLLRKLDMLANSIASFSNKPLNFIFYIGLLITVSAMGLVAYLVGRYLAFGNSVTGWTSLIVSLWTLGGLILLALGLIGIYLAKMFSEVKDRPYTIIRSITRGGA